MVAGQLEAEHRADRRDNEDERHQPGSSGREIERLGGPVERYGVEDDEQDDDDRAEREAEDPATAGVAFGHKRGLPLLRGLPGLLGRASALLQFLQVDLSASGLI